MTQEWRDIAAFPGCAVSDYGNIMNVNSGRPLKTRTNNQGFVMVGMTRDGVQYTRSVAILVAKAFVPFTTHKWFDSLIHLNGDRSDCRAMNLMWRSRPFAMRYHNMFKDLPFRTGVYIPEKDRYFSSLREACTTYGLVEQLAYNHAINGDPCFPYSWTMELTNN